MIYLLYGEFESEIDKYINKLISDNKIDTKIIYNYKETKIEDVIEECSYTDLFGNKKMVILNDAIFLTGKETLESDLLNKYLDSPNENIILVFKVVYDKLDERKKLVKLIKSKSIVKEFKILDDKNIREYISNYFKELDFKIDSMSINEIANRLIGNTKVIDNELEKLYLYKLNEKNINIDDVKKVVTVYNENEVFKLVDAVVKKDKKKIFDIYKNLLINKEEPIMILTLLANQFRLMYECKVLYEKGMNYKEIATKLKEHPYRVQVSVNNSFNISKKEIKRILVMLAKTDLDIKSGIFVKEKALESFFLEL